MGSKCSPVVSLLMTLLSSAFPTDIPSTPRKQSEELVGATAEMQKANTFVMLVNMSPLDTRFQGNVTFLMPNDRMLSNMMMPEGLLQASCLGIQSRHLCSLVPCNCFPQEQLFQVLCLTICSQSPTMAGRILFSIISPNTCVAAGSSIRCHGIDGVLSEETVSVNNSSFPSPPCPDNIIDNSSMSSPPVSSSPSYPSPSNSLSPPLLIAPSSI